MILRQIRLASSQMLLTTSPRLANNAGSLPRLSQLRQGRVFRMHAGASENAKKKYGDVVHSRFAGQELDLICNHNFV